MRVLWDSNWWGRGEIVLPHGVDCNDYYYEAKVEGMGAPPPALTWLSIVLGIILALLKIREYWINRGRLEFRVISANQYYQNWEHSYTHVAWQINAGDCKRAFVVLEFAIKNSYLRDVSVGRFMISDWMFADRYTPAMYDYQRDYQVFDLYTREPTSLDQYKTVPPGGSCGLRVEMFEEAYGPEHGSFRNPHTVELPDRYSVEFQTDTGKVRHIIKVSGDRRQMIYDLPQAVYRWSELLGPVTPGTGGAPLPQSLQRPVWRSSWRTRLRNWYRNLRAKIRKRK